MDFKTFNESTATTQEIIKLNASFARKLTFSRHKNIEKVKAIENYFKENVFKGKKIRFPERKANKDEKFDLSFPERKIKKEEYFDCLLNKETGEYLGQYEILLKSYYDIRKQNKAIYAKFNQSGQEKQQLMSCWHSLNKIDSIWNFRKAGLIKKVWKKVLADDKLYEKYDVCHLTLTVPHSGGIWKGKRFYARELLAAFNIMRKDKDLKEMIYGGEYGLEHTHTEKNGFHIHLHCLTFQEKDFKINEVRELLQEKWKKITGGSLHYEGLYVHLKDDKGRWIIENIPAKVVKTDFDEFTLQEAYDLRKKFYLGNKYEWYRKLSDDQKQNAYCSGILECIKYHFKDDVFKDKQGNWDIEYMQEVLNHSKGLRMYSKFGGFIGDKRLNYFKKNEKPKEEVTEYRMSQEEFNEICMGTFCCGDDEHIEVTTKNNDLLIRVHNSTITNEEEENLNEYDELKPNIDNAVKFVVNPFTMKLAEEHEYGRYISFIEKMNYTINPYKKETYQHVADKRHYFKINDNLKMKEVMKLLYKNQLRDLLEPESFQKYLAYVQKREYSLN